MPDSPSTKSESDFVCGCDEGLRSACGGGSFPEKHEGKRYCVLHFPGKQKSVDFQKALQSKLDNKDFNFRGVWFPDEVSFSSNDFSAEANFYSATFSAEANFNNATFNAWANFNSATFSAGAFFNNATFSAEASFQSATFSAEASFSSATFSVKANFNNATFSAEASFYNATFSAGVSFSSATFSAEASFQSAALSAGAFFNNVTFSAEVFFTSAIFSAEASFPSATFSREAKFSSATFSAEASFQSATFSAKANFSSATFSATADFRFATFNEPADFTSATFRAKAYFFSATFGAAAIFSRATFQDANFTFAIFSAVASFNEAIFANYVEFAGNQDRQPFSKRTSLDLQFATIEKSDRVSFHTLRLHPHWFMNVDPRKFDFTNVKWSNSGKAKLELKLLRSKDASPDETQESPAESSGATDSDKATKDQIKKLHRLLAQACQRLAANCEDNNRYRKASHFRRMAQDAERLETWHGFDFRKLNWWYWLASGYGERPFQALLVLIGILVLFGFLYTRVGFVQWEPRLVSEADVRTAQKDHHGTPLGFPRSFSYSAGVMTLQKPEPKPATTTAQTIVLLETILGPLQAALLALAIRRKFMR